MSTQKTVSIYAPANRHKNYVAHDVSVRKVANYSQYANYRYFPGPNAKKPYGEGEKRSTSTREYDLGENINEEFARTIAIHIKNSDPTNPVPLTLELFSEDRSFKELVQIYRIVGWGFKCPRDRHDNSIRDDLRAKMYAIKDFTFADFLLIAENVEFDRGLVHSAMDRAAFLHIRDLLDEDIKMEIENYCKAKGGWWDSLLDTVGKVEVKISEHDAEKEADERKREEQKARAERRARGRERAKAANEGGRGKQGGKGKEASKGKEGGKGKKGSGKQKAEKPAASFVHKEDDFPPLS